jgi:hypothetical protein
MTQNQYQLAIPTTLAKSDNASFIISKSESSIICLYHESNQRRHVRIEDLSVSSVQDINKLMVRHVSAMAGDVYEMCNRVMYLLIHEISERPAIREWPKDAVWREASFINGVHEFGLGLRDTVFKILAEREDITDLGERVRITEQGATRPENQTPAGLYIHGRSYLNP